MRKDAKFPHVVRQGSVAVKIYRSRNRGSTLYQVADFTSGKRRLRGFSDIEEAKKEAAFLANRLANGDIVASELTARDRASFARAIQILKPTATPLELAAASFAQAHALLGDATKIVEAARFYANRHPSNYPRKSICEAVEEFLSSKKSTGASTRYVQDLAYRLGRMSEAFRGDLSDLDGVRIQNWFEAEEFSARSRINFRRVLGLFIDFCKRRGWLPGDWDELERIESVKPDDTGAILIFTPEEMARLLHAAKPNFVPALAIGAFAGLRTAELERLEWHDVRLSRRLIEVTALKAKTRSRRLVPISDNLAEWLTPYARREGLIWSGGRTTICDEQSRTGVEAGVPWKRNGLRHSFISYRLASVQDVARVALEAGNSADVIFKHYRELTTIEESHAWFAIGPTAALNVVALKQASV